LAGGKVVRIGDFSRELKEFTNRSLADQRKAVVRGVEKSIPELVRTSPVDTGQYASSWSFTSDEKSVILGNFAPHAPIIENGARPFKPPIGPLLAWAKRVLGDSSQPPNYSNHVWALAVYTQKKIEKEGMKPRAILEKAMPMILENIKEEFKKL
jgi:hypothetical protein